jgi:hypothetical protein
MRLIGRCDQTDVARIATGTVITGTQFINLFDLGYLYYFASDHTHIMPGLGIGRGVNFDPRAWPILHGVKQHLAIVVMVQAA